MENWSGKCHLQPLWGRAEKQCGKNQTMGKSGQRWWQLQYGLITRWEKCVLGGSWISWLHVKATSLKASPSARYFLPMLLADPFLPCIFFFQSNQSSTKNWPGISHEWETLYKILISSQVAGTCCNRRLQVKMAFSLKDNKIFPQLTKCSAVVLASPETSMFVVFSRETLSSNTGITSMVTLTCLLLVKEGLEWKQKVVLFVLVTMSCSSPVTQQNLLCTNPVFFKSLQDLTTPWQTYKLQWELPVTGWDPEIIN